MSNKLNIVKMSIYPKLSYKCNTNAMNIQANTLVNFAIIKFTWKCKWPRIAKAVLTSKDKGGKITLPISRLIVML